MSSSGTGDNSGNANSVLGAQALYFNTTGSNNSALGFVALYNNTTGSQNSALGRSALESNTTGSYNTALGYQAGYGITTGAYNIVIGQNVEAPTVTSNQQLNIGNLIYGTGIYNGSSVSAAPVLNSKLGVGTSTPFAKLSIHAFNGETNTALFAVASSTASATTTLFVINNNGNVGVGTTSPAQTLSVLGHCVTGDTRLRRRRRRRKKKNSKSEILNSKQISISNDPNSKHESLENYDLEFGNYLGFSASNLGFDYEYVYDEVRIDEVKPGDEIASLDETTGKIAWRRVNALMYMGVKPIYKLTTASGKTIRTTAEHPYLVGEVGSRPKKHESPIAGAGWLEASMITEGDVVATADTGSNAEKLRAVGYIDYANLKSWLADKKLRIDLDVLHSALAASGVQEVRFYYGSDEQGRNTSFFNALRGMGYMIITKPVQYFAVRLLDILQRPRNKRWLDALSPTLQKTLFEEAGKLDARGIGLFEPKANFDVEITADALEMADAYDAVLLFSGDGDFADLARRIR